VLSLEAFIKVSMVLFLFAFSFLAEKRAQRPAQKYQRGLEACLSFPKTGVGGRIVKVALERDRPSQLATHGVISRMHRRMQFTCTLALRSLLTFLDVLICYASRCYCSASQPIPKPLPHNAYVNTKRHAKFIYTPAQKYASPKTGPSVPKLPLHVPGDPLL
jgi:hypothetical protein